MSARDKAIELVTKYAELDFGCNDKIVFSKMHKKQALLAVDELLEYENRMLDEWTRYFEGKVGQMKIERLYWEEVKQQIQLL